MLKALPLYQVDAFTNRLFSGNPAAVILLERELAKERLLAIARENALPESAFILPLNHQRRFKLRWFTPDMEMDLCGHATLAAAHTLFNHLGYLDEEILFETLSGKIRVKREGKFYLMEFPIREGIKSTLPVEIARSLSIEPQEIYKARDYMLLYKNEAEIKNLVINRSIIDKINIDPGGVVVTAPGRGCDFVSRYFTPQATLFEDPVTGSAHSTLAPYWAKRLNKKSLYAKQLSERGGELYCMLHKNGVTIKGEAVTYLKGEISISNKE